MTRVLRPFSMCIALATAALACPVHATDELPTPRAALPTEGPMPTLAGATAWIDGGALTPAALRGKVVLVDFWTYSCINSLRQIPYLRAWQRHYGEHGLVIVGVHSPEFAFEKDLGNVRRAVRDIAPGYAVAVDSDHAVWRAFDNEYWPALYFVDAQGRIRHRVFGEGQYADAENVIRTLLAEAGQTNLPPALTDVKAVGVEAQADWDDLRTEETYVGYARAERLATSGGARHDRRYAYVAPTDLGPGHWSFDGDWTVGAEAARTEGPAALLLRFHARDVHLVMGPAVAGKPIRFRVLIDGKPPGADHGLDVDADGRGTLTTPRMYQLVRQRGAIVDRTVRIEFDDAGGKAYSFTFG